MNLQTRSKKIEFETTLELDDRDIWIQGIAMGEISEEFCGYFAGVYFVDYVSIEKILKCICTSKITGVEVEDYTPTPEEMKQIKALVWGDDKAWSPN